MPSRDHAALRMEYVPIEELKPDAANPRRIKDAELDNLTQSLRKFGFVQPLVARLKDGVIIGGHQRLLAARRLGLKEVPVIYLDVSVEERRLLNLGLNRISGEWDEQLLAQLLAELRPVEGIDLQLSGFSIEEVEQLLKSLDVREKRERLETFDLEAALEAATTAPQAQHGDLFALGDHRLLCGDAANEADVARLMNGTKAALAFTDPPYNVDYGHHGNPRWGRNRPIKNDSLSTEEWEAFCRSWAKTLLGSVDGAIYVCMSCKEWPVVSRILEESDAHWSTTIIWSKDRFTLGRADYQGVTSRSGMAGGRGPSTTGAGTGTRMTCGESKGPQSTRFIPQ